MGNQSSPVDYVNKFPVTIFLTICGVLCVKLAHSSLRYRENTFITHLNIKSDVSIFLFVYMVAVSYISQESWGFCTLLLRNRMMCTNNQIHYDLMVVFVCLHISLTHYDLSQCIELLKCLSGTFCLECVSKIKTILSIIFQAIYEAVCIQLTHFSSDDCENTCPFFTIIFIKSKVWPIGHCLGLGHETIVCAVCLFIFLWKAFPCLVVFIMFCQAHVL